VAPSNIQNGGENQDGRQTIKRYRIVRNNANNFATSDFGLFKKYHRTTFLFKLKNG
jgi:hypothetical protein